MPKLFKSKTDKRLIEVCNRIHTSLPTLITLIDDDTETPTPEELKRLHDETLLVYIEVLALTAHRLNAPIVDEKTKRRFNPFKK